VDAFLDIARRNFCEATEAAHELIRALRERTGLESPRLDYTATGMFQIKVTRSDFGRYSVNASHIDASLPTLHAIDALGDDDVDIAFDDEEPSHAPPASSGDAAIDAIDAISAAASAAEASRVGVEKLADRYVDKFDLEIEDEAEAAAAATFASAKGGGEDEEDEFADEFGYAFEGKAREGKTHRKEFVAKPMPKTLVTDVKSMPMEAFAEGDEEEEGGEGEEGAGEDEEDEDAPASTRLADDVAEAVRCRLREKRLLLDALNSLRREASVTLPATVRLDVVAGDGASARVAAADAAKSPPGGFEVKKAAYEKEL